MTAIVAGEGLGLLNTSLGLGANGQVGDASWGRNGGKVYVNASTGNLVVQQRDEWLVGVGPDAGLVRTYNSLANNDYDNGDQWRFGFNRRVYTSGGKLYRVDDDGLVREYAQNGAVYVSKAGPDTYDTLSWSSSTGKWTWTDGSTQVKEVYEQIGSTGEFRLATVSDIDGTTVRLELAYDTSNRLASVKSGNGEYLYFDYVAGTSRVERVRKLSTTANPLVTYTYDTAGRLYTVAVDLTPDDAGDSVKYTTTYEYTTATSLQLASIYQDDRSRLTFTYYADGRIKTVTDKRGSDISRVSTYTYDTVNGKTTVTDADNQVTELLYYTSGTNENLLLKGVRLKTAGGAVLQSLDLEYNSDGNLTKLRDGRGKDTVYDYDANGNRKYERDSEGNVVRRYFNGAGQLVQQVTYSGKDTSGTTDPTGPLRTYYVYNGSQLRLTVTPEGRVTQYTYNALGQRQSMLEFTGSRYTPPTPAPDSLTENDFTSWLAAADKTKTERTDYTYDVRGQLATQKTYGSVNSSGVGIVDDKTVTQYFTFDPAGNLRSVRDGRADILTTRDEPWVKEERLRIGVALGWYGSNPLPPGSEPALSSLTTDQLNQLKSLFTTLYTYDGLNRLKTITDGLGNLTRTTYTETSRLTQVQAANGSSTTTMADVAGHVTLALVTDSLNSNLSTTSYGYDKLGRMRWSATADDVYTYYLYDAAGRKVGEVDGDRGLTEYVYNGNGQLARTVRYANRVDATNLMAADPLGLTLATVKGWVTANNDLDRYSYSVYDNAGRLIRAIGATGAVVAYQYDGSGRLIRTTAYGMLLDASQMTALKSAPIDLQASDIPVVAGTDRENWRFYDKDGLLVGELDGDFYYTEHSYDAGGRLIQSVRYDSKLTNGAWSDAASRPPVVDTAISGQHVLRVKEKDLITSYAYDARGQLVRSFVASRYDATAGQQFGFVTAFQYDAVGNKLSETRYAREVGLSNAEALATVAISTDPEDHSTGYAYDSNNRLVQTKARPEGLVTTYQYDSVGNLVEIRRGADQGDARSTRSRYDGAGRLTGELSAEGAKQLDAWLASHTSATAAEKTTATDNFWKQYGTQHLYDGSGRRIATITPEGGGGTAGNKTVFYYDGAGRLTHSINALGEVVEHTFNVFGEEIGKRRLAQRWTGAADGGLASWLGSLGYSSEDSLTLTAYSSGGSAVKLTDELGQETQLYYNAFGQVEERTDAVDRIEYAGQTGRTVKTSYVYNGRGSLTSEVKWGEVLQFNASYGYDAFGRVISSLDLAGVKSTTYEYDKLGRVVVTKDRVDVERRTTYDAFGRVKTTTDGNGQVTEYVYDSTARKLTVTTPEQVQTITETNRYGETVKVTVKHASDPVQRVTVYTYDRDGRVTGVTSASGSSAQSTVTTTYDEAGRVIETRDAANTLTRTTYDAASRVLKRVVDPGGLEISTEYFYDGKGQVAWELDPNGVWTKTEYDKKGQVVAVTIDPSQVLKIAGVTYGPKQPHSFATVANTGALNLRTEYKYDAQGHTLVVAQGVDLSAQQPYAQAQVTRYEYDKLGRRTKEIVDPKRSPNWVRGAADDNAAGKNLTTTYTYDGNNNVIARTDAMNNVTRYVYDREERVVREIDATGAVVKNEYDKEGRLSARTAFVNRINLASLPASGANVTQIDALVVANAADQLTRQVYDNNGRLTFSIDALNYVTQRTYDAAGNVVTLTRYSSPLENGLAKEQEQGVMFRYAAPTIVAPSGTVTGTPPLVRRSDAADQIEQTVYDAGNRAIWSIDAMRGATRRYFDANGNVLQIRRFLNTAPSPLGVNVAPTLQETASDQLTWFNYDRANRVTFKVTAALQGQAEVTENRYDKLGRLTWQIRFANRTQWSSSTPFNAIVGVSTAPSQSEFGITRDTERDQYISYAYDNAGRLTAEAQGKKDYYATSLGTVAQLTTRTWDKAGRLEQLIAGDGTPDKSVTRYAYDAAGRLGSETRGYGTAQASTTSYDLDGLGRRIGIIDPRANEIANSDSEWAQQARLALGKPQFVAGFQAGDSDFVKAKYTVRQEFDAAGRVIKRTDAMGFVTQTEYDAFGNAIKVTDPNGNPGYFYFNKRNEVTWQIDPEGYAVQTVYNAFGTVDSITRYNGKIKTKGAGALGTSLQPEERSTEPGTGDYVYVIKLDSRDRKTILVHDNRNQQTKITDSAGFFERTVYDIFGNKKSYFAKSFTSAKVDGGEYVYNYDLAGRVVSERQPVQVTQVNASNGAVSLADVLTTYVYDTRGNLIEKKEAAGLLEERKTTYAYDLLDRLVSQTGEGMPTWTATQGASSAPPVETRSYDARGNLVEVKAADGSRTLTYWDALDRKAASLSPTGTLTVYRYNTGGDVIAQRVYSDPVSLPVVAGGVVPNPVDPYNYREVAYAYDRNNREISQTVRGSGHTAQPNLLSPQSQDFETAQWSYASTPSAAAPASIRDQSTNWTLDGGHTLFLSQPDAAARTQSLKGPQVEVTAGQLYEASFYVLAQSCTAQVEIVWLDANGNELPKSTSVASSTPAARTSASTLDQYEKLAVVGKAPAGARYARLNLIKNQTTSPAQSSVAYATRAYLGLATNLAAGSSYGVEANVTLSPAAATAATRWTVSGSPNNTAIDRKVDESTAYTLSGGHTLSLKQTDANTGRTLNADSGSFDVIGGQTYEASVYMQTQRSVGQVKILWYAADGSYISNSDVASAKSHDLNGRTGASSLEQYEKITAIGVAPANAAKAVLRIVKEPTLSGADSVAYVTQPFFGLSQSGILVGEVNAATGNFEIKSQELTSQKSYDSNGNLVRETDARQNATWHFYDKAGREAVTVDADRYVTVRSYTSFGEVALETRYATRLPDSGANAVDLGSASTTADLIKTKIAAVALPEQDRATLYSVDKMGRVTSKAVSGWQDAYTVNATGGLEASTIYAETKYEYNGLGQVTKRTEATSEVLTWEFDKQGREVKRWGAAFADVVTPTGTVRQRTDTEYNALGLSVRSIERDGDDGTETGDRITRYSYDKGGFLSSQVDAMGAETTYTHDMLGRVTSKQSARLDADYVAGAGNANSHSFTDRTEYTYDRAGRQVLQEKKGRDATTSTFTVLDSEGTRYSVHGEVEAKTKNGAVTQLSEYDEAGRIVRSSGPGGVPKIYVRDSVGNVTLTITPPASEQVTADRSAVEAAFMYSNVDDRQIKAVMAAGAHASVGVFDKRNLQTDTYELANGQVYTNASGVIAYAGKSPTAVEPPASVTQTGTIYLDNNVTASFTLDSTIYWANTGGSNDKKITRIEYKVKVTISASTLPGPNLYTVQFNADSGRAPEKGWGSMPAFGMSKSIASNGVTNSDELTSTQYPSGGELYLDWGVLSPVTYRLEIFKQLTADQTLPNSKVFVAGFSGQMVETGLVNQNTTPGTGLFSPYLKTPQVTGQVTSNGNDKMMLVGLPPATTKVILSSHAVGFPDSPWTTKVVDYSGGAALFDTGHLGNALADIASQTPQQGLVEYQAYALDAQSNTLQVLGGKLDVAITNGSAAFRGVTPANPPYNKAGTTLPGEDGAIRYISPVGDTGAAKGLSAKLRYRPSGSVTWIEASTLGMSFEAGMYVPGWFSFNPASLGLAAGQRYEYLLEVKDAAGGAGNTIRTVASSFVVGDTTNIVQPTLASERPTTLHFNNVPAGATDVKVTYTGSGFSGTRTATLVSLGGGRYDWDAADAVAAGSATYLINYELVAKDSAGNVLTRYAGREGINTKTPLAVEVESINSASGASTKISGPIVKLRAAMPGNVQKLRLYYKSTSASTYQSMTVDGVLNSWGAVEYFFADLTGMLPAGAASADLDIYYVYLASNGTEITGSITDYAPKIGNPTLLKLVPQESYEYEVSGASLMLTNATDGANASHRSQAYNAFGEVVQEFDPMAQERMRLKAQQLGRALTTSEIDTYATSLSYDVLGNLIEKKDAQTSATLENGFQQVQRASTLYHYDLQRRLVGVTDGNGNQTTYLLRKAGDGERIVAQEFRPQGEDTKYEYDVFGDLRRTTVENDAKDAITDNVYDKNHRLVRVDRPGSGSSRATDLYTYDAAGNRIKHLTSPDAMANASNVFASGRVYTDKTFFDGIGRVTDVVSAGGLKTHTDYLNLNNGGVRQTKLDENGNTGDEYFDAMGRLTAKYDLARSYFKFDYNLAGNLIRQYRANAATGAAIAGQQDIRYGYHGDGYIKSIEDVTLQTSTLYEYDKAGNKTFEGYITLADKSVLQSTSIAYDELNRIRSISDNAYSLTYEYDKVGNRRRVLATKSGTTEVQDYWYTYDKMNRMVISMGVLNGGRSTAVDTTSRISRGTSGKGVTLGYDKAGNRVSASYANNSAEERYTYSEAGYLTLVEDPTKPAGSRTLSVRTNDLLGRVYSYVQYNSTGPVTQTFAYDEDGKVLESTSIGVDSENKSQSSHTWNNYNKIGTSTKTGLLQTSETRSGPTGEPDKETTQWTKYVYALFDSAQQSEIRTGADNPQVQSSWGTWAQGFSKFEFDVNGHVNKVYDAAKGGTLLSQRREINYVNNAQGLIMYRMESGPTGTPLVHSYYYVDGRRVGESGNVPSATGISYSEALAAPAKSSADRYKNIGPIRSDFDQNYQPINQSYPAFTSGTYVVKTGETLPSIARAMWGDESLWYLIAEANNIQNQADLDPGETIVIPNKVTNFHNTSRTSRVYNPGEAMGDTAPTLPDAPRPPPTPSGGDDCGVFLQILVIAVAAVVTWGVGSGLASLGYINPVAYGLGAAAGSVASQAVAIATGLQQDFSWKSVALAAVGGAVSGGLGELKLFDGAASSFANTVSRAAIGNVVSQGIGVITGLQEKFSWTGVAMSAAGAAASWGVQEMIGSWQYDDPAGPKWESIRDQPRTENNFVNTLVRGTASGIAGGLAQAVVAWNKPNWESIAISSFGSALGDGVINAIVNRDKRATPAPVENRDVVIREPAPVPAPASVSSSSASASGGSSMFGDIRFTADGMDFSDKPQFDLDGLSFFRGKSGQPVTRVAEKGDSWARLAKLYYGDERYALALAQANGARSTLLKAGQSVQFPDLAGANLKQGGRFIVADAAAKAEIKAEKMTAAAQSQAYSPKNHLSIGGSEGSFTIQSGVGNMSVSYDAGLTPRPIAMVLPYNPNAPLPVKIAPSRLDVIWSSSYDDAIGKMKSTLGVMSEGYKVSFNSTSDDAPAYQWKGGDSLLDFSAIPGVRGFFQRGWNLGVDVLQVGLRAFEPRTDLSFMKVPINGGADKFGAVVFDGWSLGAGILSVRPANLSFRTLAGDANALELGNVERSSLRQTGAAGPVAGEDAWAAAERIYTDIRADTTDVAKIAQNTGIKPENIQKVKDHVFFKEHLLDRYRDYGVAPEWARFDASPEMADSWLRLTAGTQTKIDMELLKHETAEAWFMRKNGPSYLDAHTAAERRYPSPY